MDVYEITVNGKKYIVEVGDTSSSPVQVVVNGVPKTVDVVRGTRAAAAAPAPASAPVETHAVEEPVVQATPVTGEGQVVSAPMPGKVLSVRVAVGDTVKEGDTVCTLEAMKMEMPIGATASGTVQAIHVNVGDTVPHDAPLVSIG
ncbi:MAG TPA: acetyl-CoA carboxylase biotin carboxyl carrier protein subunit [Chloroflexi bacterium]|nr:acetyl-CoA carboxylase biotin carboxyl carrier protein subunit [Chloroflexota bacterium]